MIYVFSDIGAEKVLAAGIISAFYSGAFGDPGVGTNPI